MYRQGLMAGDYYGRRNLAAGDPGLFGFLGRTLGGAIKGFIGGGPLGALTGAAKGALGQHPVLRQNPIGATLAPAAQMLPSFPTLMGPGPGRPVPGIKGVIQRALPGGETGHAKRRRLNVTNPKALRRAIRRARGFEKLALKTIRLVNPQRRGRFGGFKSGRKKA